METKHTPGPWNAHSIKKSAAPPYTPVSATTLIAQVYSTAFGDHEQSEANARLIAAAPDLLEAVKRLLPDVLWVADYWANDPDKDGDIVFARAAIAKATGEQG